ncbi:DUF6884 domain-containing protein [Pontibacter pamirensis]|uniref:DUF6884 domain-containing protein n=1 Tax=Pontibacter pamirensis TaxID=2562824 RepID=UPI001389F2CC|nr:DUF6884 domain-containing protein [Pontibacter pamirensis]
MAIVYLISCVSVKKASKAAAADLYISSWFKKARAYTEKRADAWFILSAQYGLVRPDALIEPYEKTLNAMRKKERLEWADNVMKSILSNTTVGDHVVFLAGARYREFLAGRLSQLGYTVEAPLANMGIGEQLSWLGENKK